MNIIQTFERVEKLHLLIASKKTGKPDELARRLGISRATLYNMIEELKSYNLCLTTQYNLLLEISVHTVEASNCSHSTTNNHKIFFCFNDVEH